MLNVVRWISSIVGFLRFRFAIPKKDESGKISGFLYTSDDPNVADYFSVEQVFDRRVFVSFERESLALAERFEAALRHRRSGALAVSARRNGNH